MTTLACSTRTCQAHTVYIQFNTKASNSMGQSAEAQESLEMLDGMLYAIDHPALSSAEEARARKTKCFVLLGEMLDSFDHGPILIKLSQRNMYVCQVSTVQNNTLENSNRIEERTCLEILFCQSGSDIKCIIQGVR